MKDAKFMSTGQTLLVTGASGHLGRRVVELLVQSGATHIIAASRTPEKLSNFAEQGVIVRYANFDEPDSLQSAFAGVDRLLLISTDATGTPGLRQRQHTTALEAAAAANVKHVIYTSLINPVNSPILIAPDHAATEAALEASPLGYTVLRNNLYADMLLQTLGQTQISGGKLFNAIGEGKVSYVTREDCARAAAAALAPTFEGRRILDITGSEALSQSDVAAIGASLSGQPITYVPLTPDLLKENLAKAGLPEFVIELIASFDAAAAQGKLSVVSNSVEELTGQKPTRIAEFLAAHLQVLP
jgi:NAD(P)H dehydrogenase (quinone)